MTDKNKHGCSDEELAQMAGDGDTEALTELIFRYMPLIRSRAQRYSFAESDRDDFVQEGLIGLVKAVRSYDSTRNTTFKTYCNICITSKMLSGISLLLSNKHHAMQDYLSIEQLETSDSGLKSLVSGNDGPDPLDWYVQQEEKEYMQQQIRTLLSGLEQETLSLYLSGHSYEEMAMLLNSTTKAVDNALQRVRRKLRDAKS